MVHASGERTRELLGIGGSSSVPRGEGGDGDKGVSVEGGLGGFTAAGLAVSGVVLPISSLSDSCSSLSAIRIKFCEKETNQKY